jgi:hypothetical protein
MPIDPMGLAVGRVAQHLAAGYCAFLVAHLVAVNTKSIRSLSPAKVLGEDPTDSIRSIMSPQGASEIPLPMIAFPFRCAVHGRTEMHQH